jgi:Matrixin/IPT/TIG domain
MKRAANRVLTLAASLLLASSIASAYYHWTYFASHNTPYNPIHAHFDLNALPNQTLSYFISDDAPGPLTPGDSFASIVSQIRAAAAVWNQVPQSSLRLSFGGLENAATLQTTPGIDLVFDDDMPPGLLAETQPTMPDDLSSVSNGASFVKILRSRVQLRRDLTVYNESSFSDVFFLTVVHELGHSLGLQHTLTSGVMATAETRATTTAAPLSADDIAGLALLYPAPGFQSSTGSIAGTVRLNGSGVNLASVVALSTGGVAVSSLTNPDGTYRIDGLAPGQYYVYVQPLPPSEGSDVGSSTPDDIILPRDTQNSPFPADTGFGTQFYPGTQDWTQAAVIPANAGAVTAGVDFNVQPRSGPAVPYMVTFGYQGQVSVPEPPLPASSQSAIVFYAPGTTTADGLAPGLGVSIIGSSAQIQPNSLSFYPGTNGYAYFWVNTAAVEAAIPVALAVTVAGDLYVLPDAFTVVPSAPPAISSVSGTTDAQGSTTLTVAGSNLNASTRILMDGVPAPVLAVNDDGSLSVAAPPATAGYSAAVEALSNDGQTSWQGLGTAAPPFYTYEAPENPAISVNGGYFLPGADSLVDIIGVNTTFVDGQVTVGFGSSDIAVKRIWVLNPQRLLLNISVSPAAQPGPVDLTVATGLQMLSLNGILQVQAAHAGQASLRTPILNAATGLAGVSAGDQALISTSGLPSSLTGWTLTIDGVQTSFLQGQSGQILASVPGGLPLGAAIVQLSSPNGDVIPPVVMQMDAPRPQIAGVVDVNGVPVDTSHPAGAGDTISLAVVRLGDSPSAAVAEGSVHVHVAGIDNAGVDVPVTGLLPGSQPGAYQVQVVLGANVPYGPSQLLTVRVGTRQSNPFSLAIHP